MKVDENQRILSRLAANLGSASTLRRLSVFGVALVLYLSVNIVHYHRIFALDENNYVSIADNFRTILASLLRFQIPSPQIVEAFFNYGWWGPLVPIVFGILGIFFSPEFIRMLFAFVWAGSALLVFEITLRIVSRPAAYLALALFLGSPFVLYFSYVLTTQSLNIFFFLLVIWLLIRHDDRPLGGRFSERAFAAAPIGIAIGLGILSRTQMIPFIAFVALFVAMGPRCPFVRRLETFVVICCAAAVVVVPWMTFVYVHAGRFAVTLMNSTAILSTYDFDFGSFNGAFHHLLDLGRAEGVSYADIADRMLAERMRTLTFSDATYVVVGNLYDFFTIKNSDALIESMWVVSEPFLSTRALLAIACFDGVLRVLLCISSVVWLLAGSTTDRHRLLIGGAAGAQVLIVAIANVHGRYFLDLYPFLVIAGSWGLVRVWQSRSMTTAIASVCLIGFAGIVSFSAISGQKNSPYTFGYSATHSAGMQGLLKNQDVSIRDSFDIAVPSSCLPSVLSFGEKGGRKTDLLFKKLPNGAKQLEVGGEGLMDGASGGLALEQGNWLQTTAPVGFIYSGPVTPITWRVGVDKTWYDLPVDHAAFHTWRTLGPCLFVRWNGYYPALT